MALLEIRDLRKSYRSPDGTVTAVLDIPAFAVDAGEQVALEGQSGSGKTTLLNIIAGILTPDEGTVHVGDQEIAGLAESQRDLYRANRLGYVFQTFNLLQGYTALENVLLGMMFGVGADRERARSLLAQLGLGDRMDYRPRQLSIGQQQRVALARALVNQPELVLADEPTGNLDRNTARDALTLIQDTCTESGAALLLVSHDPAVLGEFSRCERLSDVNRAAMAQGGAA